MRSEVRRGNEKAGQPAEQPNHGAIQLEFGVCSSFSHIG